MAQGSRVSSGLGPIEQVSSLRLVLKPIIDEPSVPLLMDAIKDIQAAGLIPDIYLWAEGTLRRATDASQFGSLVGNVLSAYGIAYLMCYTDEVTTPALYQDMNTKCHAINCSSIQPYGRFLAGVLKHVRRLKPHPNSQVFRGV